MHPFFRHNTDAVDIHGSPFYVHGVNFTTGDDNVAAHANHTLVEDSFFGTGHGASIGSLCGEWLTNITFRNITFEGSTCGARIKSHPNCRGHVWNVTWENLTMHNVAQAVDVTQFYFGTGPSTFLFDDVLFKDIDVHYSGGAAAVAAAAEAAAAAAEKREEEDKAMVEFDCDDHYDGHANCRVRMENVRFLGWGGGGANMTCKGTTGNVSGLVGINNCLKEEGVVKEE